MDNNNTATFDMGQFDSTPLNPLVHSTKEVGSVHVFRCLSEINESSMTDPKDPENTELKTSFNVHASILATGTTASPKMSTYPDPDAVRTIVLSAVTKGLLESHGQLEGAIFKLTNLGKMPGKAYNTVELELLVPKTAKTGK